MYYSLCSGRFILAVWLFCLVILWHTGKWAMYAIISFYYPSIHLPTAYPVRDRGFFVILNVINF